MDDQREAEQTEQKVKQLFEEDRLPVRCTALFERWENTKGGIVSRQWEDGEWCYYFLYEQSRYVRRQCRIFTPDSDLTLLVLS